jgi:hypothetical protein
MSTNIEAAVRDVTRAMADAQGIPPSIIADIEAASHARSRPGPVCRCGFHLPADHPPAATDDDDERRMLLRLALLNGIPWTLAAEAAASVALSRDDEVGTYSLEEEQ